MPFKPCVSTAGAPFSKRNGSHWCPVSLGAALAVALEAVVPRSAVAQTAASVSESAEEQASTKFEKDRGAQDQVPCRMALQGSEERAQLESSPEDWLNVGNCRAQLGQFVKALAAFRAAREAALRRTDSTAQHASWLEQAEKSIDDVSRRLPELTLRRSPTQGARVAINQQRIELFDVPLPLDPGDYDVTVSAEGKQTTSKRFTFTQGQKLTVTLPSLAEIEPPSPDESTASPGPAGPPDASKSDVEDEAAAAPRPGAHLHDGLFFQGALGTGFDASNVHTKTPGGNRLGAEWAGWGVGGQIAIGATPWRGLVVGGAAYASLAPDAHVKSVSVNGRSAPNIDDSPYVGGLEMIGPFADWYFNPSGGMHAQLALCFSHFNLWPQGDGLLKGNGFGFVVGYGYEWWVGDQWSLGVLGRLQAAFPALRGSTTFSDQNAYTSSLFVPALLLSATYH